MISNSLGKWKLTRKFNPFVPFVPRPTESEAITVFQSELADHESRMERVRRTVAGLRDLLNRRFPEVPLGFDLVHGTTKTASRKDGCDA